MTKTIDEPPLDIQRQAIIGAFQRTFGVETSPRVFQAPGRVNLIGEHTDYNGGFVMPVAIGFHTWVAAAPREDNMLAVHSVLFDETSAFDLDESLPAPAKHWTDYIRGVVLELQRAGVQVRGVNLAVGGNVPLGAGLSSSASVEVATAYALCALADSNLSRKELALLCQRAENGFVGARVGIMDQFVSAHGQRGHALKLDCRSLGFDLLPLPQSMSLVICNTMVKHQLASGEYNVRRQECEQGVAIIRQRFPNVSALRDVSLEMLAECQPLLPAIVFRRCRHVVTEDSRVLAAANALCNSDLSRFGDLMYQSHESLRDDYEVSCPELDSMVNIGSSGPGIIGARMTGGGFGGCTVNLVKHEDVERFRSHVKTEYSTLTSVTPQVYVTSSSDGVMEDSGERN